MIDEVLKKALDEEGRDYGRHSDRLMTKMEFVEKLINNQKDFPPEFSKIVDEHFWELIDTNK